MNKSLVNKLWRFLSGYHLAITCMVLLLVIVFFSTLEQSEEGLYIVSKRYYDISAFFVQPKLNGKAVPLILPGAYWVCAVFTVNLICGGLVRLVNNFSRGNASDEVFKKRAIKGAGVLISHFSMVFLMISGAVTYHMKESHLLLVNEKEASQIAFAPEQVGVEVREMTNGGVIDGKPAPLYVIENSEIQDLIIHHEGEAKPLFWKKAEKRQFRVGDMPFTIEMRGWHRNAQVIDAEKGSPDKNYAPDGPVVNKVFLRGMRAFTDTEIMQDKVSNIAACYLTIIPDDKKQAKQEIVMWQTLKTPVSVTVNDKVYGFQLTTEKVVLPFVVRLDKLVVDRYQGSMRNRAYQSYVTKIDNDGEQEFYIEMNEPMRDAGYTLFQTSVGKDGDGKRFSVYEVVKNPSDQWPKYAIYMCGFGLLIHFCAHLIVFINNSFKGGKKNEK